MGMRSSFQDEYGILVRDELLKAYADECVKRKQKFPHALDILEWYTRNEKFSFEMMTDWKLFGYWYPSTIQLLKVLEKFIDWLKMDGSEGVASFVYEEGNPFRFVLDPDTCTIHVSYIPVRWELATLPELDRGALIGEKKMSLPVNKVLKQAEALVLGARL